MGGRRVLCAISAMPACLHRKYVIETATLGLAWGWAWWQGRRASCSPSCSSSAEALDRLLPSVGTGRSPRKRTTSQCKSEPPLLRTSKRTIYTAGRPPWYNEHGTQSKEAFTIGESAATSLSPHRVGWAGPTVGARALSSSGRASSCGELVGRALLAPSTPGPRCAARLLRSPQAWVVAVLLGRPLWQG